MGTPDKWQQMMFAHRIKLDVLDHHNLARVGIEDRAINHVLDTEPVPLGEKLERARGAFRCLLKTLPVTILAHRIEQIPKNAFHFLNAIWREAIAFQR